MQSLGHDTRELHPRALRELRSRIGFLHQNDNLIPGLRVVHNVMMAELGDASLWRSLWSLIVPTQLDRVRAALREVELEDKLWSLPGTLSGSEQQRVALARILVQKPEVILADEPVSSLDVRLGRDVLQRFCALATEHGSTLFLSLHDLTLVDERFDRVLAIKDGSLAFDLKPKDLTPKILAELYGTEFESFRQQVEG